MNILSISKIPHADSIVIKQSKDGAIFLGSPNSIVISINTLSSVIEYLVKSGILDIGILEEIVRINRKDKDVTI